MKDDEINRRFTQHDKDIKSYIDRNRRADKRKLRLFYWISEHPWWSVLIFVVCIGIGIWISHRIDVSKTLENTTGIKIIDDRHNEVKR